MERKTYLFFGVCNFKISVPQKIRLGGTARKLALKTLTLKVNPVLIKSEYLDAKHSTEIYHVYTLSMTFMCWRAHLRIRRHIFIEEKNILIEACRGVVHSHQ